MERKVSVYPFPFGTRVFIHIRGDAACLTWRKATVDEIIEHFKNR